MTTLSKLVADGVVVRIEVQLDGEELAWRELYAYPAAGRQNYFVPWLRDTLPTMRSQVGAEDSPEEQVYGLLVLYVTGKRLNSGRMYSPLRPDAKGAWELKTVDVRIFGWFHRRDCFIAVFADDATHIHEHGLHAGYRDEVVRLRDGLDLDEPKFVGGTNENDVLSIRS